MMASAPSKADPTFPAHDPQAPFSFPREEEKVLAYWQAIDAFQTSIKMSREELERGERKRWNFYGASSWHDKRFDR